MSPIYIPLSHNHLDREAVSFYVEYHTDLTLIQRTNVLEVLAYLFTHDFFIFVDVFYLQECGAAMGMKFSPLLANLFMGWWSSPTSMEIPIHSDRKSMFFYRYIDDHLFICDRRIEDLDSFLSFLYSNTSNLAFTRHLEFSEIPFLDVLLVASESRVITRLYRKPLAGNSLLLVQSSHPIHTIRGIPVGQFVRKWRICSEDDKFERQKHLY